MQYSSVGARLVIHDSEAGPDTAEVYLLECEYLPDFNLWLYFDFLYGGFKPFRKPEEFPVPPNEQVVSSALYPKMRTQSKFEQEEIDQFLRDLEEAG